MLLILILLVFFIGVFFLARLIHQMGEAESSEAASAEDPGGTHEARG